MIEKECSYCRGFGWENTQDICKACNGYGNTRKGVCRKCGGTGGVRIYNIICPMCNGKGTRDWIDEMRRPE
jgi:DnaJ-class molecular chaperone